MSSPMFELPRHMEVPVNAKGEGPETDPRLIAGLACWCGVKGCKKYEER